MRRFLSTFKSKGKEKETAEASEKLGSSSNNSEKTTEREDKEKGKEKEASVSDEASANSQLYKAVTDSYRVNIKSARDALAKGANPNLIGGSGNSMSYTVRGGGRVPLTHLLFNKENAIEAAKLFKEYKCDFCTPCGSFKNTALLAAIAKKHEPLIDWFIENGDEKLFNTADKMVDSSYTCQNTPLILLIKAGYLQQAITLIKDKKVDVNAQSGDGKTALHWACFIGKRELIDALLNNDANPDFKDELGNKPLYYYTYPEQHELIFKRNAANEPPFYDILFHFGDQDRLDTYTKRNELSAHLERSIEAEVIQRLGGEISNDTTFYRNFAVFMGVLVQFGYEEKTIEKIDKKQMTKAQEDNDVEKMKYFHKKYSKEGGDSLNLETGSMQNLHGQTREVSTKTNVGQADREHSNLLCDLIKKRDFELVKDIINQDVMSTEAISEASELAHQKGLTHVGNLLDSCVAARVAAQCEGESHGAGIA